MMDLWDHAHSLFDTDDGSLPEVLLLGFSETELTGAYRKIRSLSGAAGVPGHPAVFWNERLGCEVEVDACPDVVGVVVRGESCSIHFGLGGVATGGVVLPWLGIFVEPDGLGLDWRMGSEWGPPQVDAFFKLIYELVSLAPRSYFEFRELDGKSFMSAWKYFLDSRKLRPTPHLGGQIQ